LTAAAADCNVRQRAGPPCGIDIDSDGGTRHVLGIGVTMAQITKFLEGFSMPDRRPIVDRAGLTGRYDVDMRFTSDDGPATDITTGIPLLKEALADALGLRLEPRTETRKALIIDRLSPPSAD
jgi:uncharacterized protein (TIGR03435 family)